jgi:hypothetical protein
MRDPRPPRLSRRALLARGGTLLAGAGLALALPPPARSLAHGHGVATSRRISGLERLARRDGATISAPTPSTPSAHTAVAVQAPAAASVWLRAHHRAGWSAWRPVPITPDEGPDSAEATSAPPSPRALAWTGASDQVQLMVHGARLEEVELLLIGGGGAPARTPAGIRTRRGDDGPPIVRRDEWLALPPRGEPQHAEAVELAFVHHTVTDNGYEADDSPGIVRAIQRHHMLLNRWNDIGYNFLVDRHGQIFEGRAGGIDEPVIGAHARGFNTGSTGVALIGDHRNEHVSDALWDALVDLLAWLSAVHGVDPHATTVRTSAGSDRYPPGERVELAAISGHRTVSRTACPGDEVDAALPALRDAVADRR